MNMKNKIREFFTLTRKGKGGFTLVELIVVIAILGILAGVAVPVYNGYIKKADRAGDEQLLAAINKAFTSACLDNAIDIYDTAAVNTRNAKLTIDSTSKQLTYGADDLVDSEVTASFTTYFGENLANKFKVITVLHFDEAKHMFVDANKAGGRFSQIFNGLANLADYKEALKGSAFATIGAAGLTEKLDTVTGLAGDLAAVNDRFAASLAGTMTSLAESMGYDLSDETEAEEFDNYMLGMINDKATQMNPEDPEAAYDAARYEILSNYAVLNAAQNTAGKDAATVISDLKEGFDVEDIKNMMSPSSDSSTQQEGMANAAMMYAMYTAYANGPECDDPEAANAIAGDISTFANAMSNTESEEYLAFQAYLETDTAKKDAEGYLAAMNIINESASSNPDAVTGLLTNGYNDPELTAALQQMMNG